MAMPTPPPKPPSRPGNSQQQVIPHERSRSREMHPAVQEAMGRYAQIWEENDKLRDENARLAHENDVLRKLDIEKSGLIDSLRAGIAEGQKVTDQRLGTQETHYRERLAEAERAKERYLRFAVSMSERVQSCISDLKATHDLAMEMAHQNPSEVEEQIANAIKEIQKGE